MITVLSWNVRSLSPSRTRQKIISFLLPFLSKPSILLLQEHHLSEEQTHDLLSVLPSAIIYSKHVITLLSREIYAALSSEPYWSVSADQRLISAYLDFGNNQRLWVHNMYAPPGSQQRAGFFAGLAFPPSGGVPSIIGGDLNDCPDPSIDRKLQSASHGHHWATLVSQLPGEFLDTIRLFQPTSPCFTRPHRRNDGTTLSWSRIDHILVSINLADSMRAARIEYSAGGSDHRPVEIRLDFAITPPPSATTALPVTSACIQRIHPATFRDPTFAAAVATEIGVVLASAAAAAASAPDFVWERLRRHLAGFASRYARTTAADRRTQLAEAVRTIQDLEALPALSSPQQAILSSATRAAYAVHQTHLETLTLRARLPRVLDPATEARTLEDRCRRTLDRSTFARIRLADGSTTTNIDVALATADEHFTQIFTPAEQDPARIATARGDLLSHLRASTAESDVRFARRIPPDLADRLDQPFTEAEVLAAVRASPSSSSPGPSGLPYEFYKQSSHALVPLLTAAFNASWERGELSRAQLTAQVRLLKKQKPGLDETALASYRPIALREADYRLLARVLVARVNPALQAALPATQVGFVPKRRSADAGRHLQFLLEELRHLDLPHAALLSLDQEKAYDLVDHDWIFACYDAYGFGPRILSLLRAIYDGQRLTARYNVNGFLSPGVKLRTGLPQGDPLSCASWVLCFQPFLDALTLRKIALSIPSPLNALRPEILTVVAFADDSVMLCSSISSSLPALHRLSDDWRLASNGRLNAAKTEALAVGALAKSDALAATVRWSDSEGYATWAGFPLTAGLPPDSFYALLLGKIQRRLNSLASIYTSRRARAIIVNSHGIARSLHLLSFAPAPSAFLHELRNVLLNYIWGSRTARHAVNAEHVFRPVSLGGLGALDPVAFDTANSLRFLDHALVNPDILWYDLALSSFARATPSFAPTTLPLVLRPAAAALWSLFRPRKAALVASSSENRFWGAIATAANQRVLQLNVALLTRSSLLSLPPLLLVDKPALRSIKSLAQLYYQSAPRLGISAGFATLPPLSPDDARFHHGLRAARFAWLTHVLSSDSLSRLLPVLASPLPLPAPTTLPPSAFSILGLPHGFSAADARRSIAERAEPCPLSPRLASYLPSPLSASVLQRVWRWIRAPPATPREADSHWLILHGALVTRRRLFVMGLAASELCVICASSSVDTLVHALFECSHSAAFWSALTALLAEHVSPAFDSFTMTPGELLLGVPTLDALSPAKTGPLLRAMVGILFQTLLNERWARIRAEQPSPSSRAPEDLASCAFITLAARLG